MKQVVAIPSSVLCPLCGCALQAEYLTGNLRLKESIVFHHYKQFRPCDNDLKEIEIPISEFLIPKGGDSHGL